MSEEFVSTVLNESDPNQLWLSATKWLEGHGFDRVMHFCATPQGQVDVKSTISEDFQNYYQDQNLSRHDPFLTYCLGSASAIATGIDYVDDYDYLTRKEKRVIHLAGEAGFRAGFSLVVRRDMRSVEAWNLGSTQSRGEVEKICAARGTELKLGLAALRDRLSQITEPNLSKRETECLDMLCQGLKPKVISHELGIAVVTVDLHLRNAREKLGATTREEAIARFVRSRLRN